MPSLRLAGVTPARLLSQALNTTPEFWVNLQAAYDLARSRPVKPVHAQRRMSSRKRLS
jgi:plasmid maintenance system antidote protein VapI